MTLELCIGIIVLKAVTMLHDTDAEFAITDFAHEVKVGKSMAVLFNNIPRYQ